MNKLQSLLILIFICFFSISCSTNTSIVNTNIEKEVIETKVIIALGDSLTAGYNLEINKSYPSQLKGLLNINGYNYKIINAGVSGNTSNQLLDRIELYDDIDANMYLLNIGSNDGLRRLDIVDMKDNIQKIINHIKTINKDSKILLFGMKIPINFGIQYSNDFSKTFKDLADSNNIFYYEFFLEGVARDISLNLNDGIHPNEKGYSIISNNIFKYLEKLKLITK